MSRLEHTSHNVGGPDLPTPEGWCNHPSQIWPLTDAERLCERQPAQLKRPIRTQRRQQYLAWCPGPDVLLGRLFLQALAATLCVEAVTRKSDEQWVSGMEGIFNIYEEYGGGWRSLTRRADVVDIRLASSLRASSHSTSPNRACTAGCVTWGYT